mmetsp:Transcript_13052/g.31898  ORF Transcript_13052/g.31898 Transcript_13052/m.31898 type:complete len:227 (-) Transcript_13052:1560-2240(-)
MAPSRAKYFSGGAASWTVFSSFPVLGSSIVTDPPSSTTTFSLIKDRRPPSDDANVDENDVFPRYLDQTIFPVGASTAKTFFAFTDRPKINWFASYDLRVSAELGTIAFVVIFVDGSNFSCGAFRAACSAFFASCGMNTATTIFPRFSNTSRAASNFEVAICTMSDISIPAAAPASPSADEVPEEVAVATRGTVPTPTFQNLASTRVARPSSRSQTKVPDERSTTCN